MFLKKFVKKKLKASMLICKKFLDFHCKCNFCGVLTVLCSENHPNAKPETVKTL
jgi:hypothetical protein